MASKGHHKGAKKVVFDPERERQKLLQEAIATQMRVLAITEPTQNQVHQGKLAHDVYLALTLPVDEKAPITVDKALEAWSKSRETTLKEKKPLESVAELR